MGYSQVPFYFHGAIFHDKDFDAKKVLVCCLEDYGAKKSQIRKIKRLAYNKKLSKKHRAIIDLVIDSDDAKTLNDLRDDINSYLTDDLVSEGHLDGLDYMVRKFDFEEQAVFSGDDYFDDDISECFFIAFTTTFPWKYEEYDGPKSKSEAAEFIKKRLGYILRDDIDWTKRLGEISGIYPN